MSNISLGARSKVVWRELQWNDYQPLAKTDFVPFNLQLLLNSDLAEIILGGAAPANGVAVAVVHGEPVGICQVEVNRTFPEVRPGWTANVLVELGVVTTNDNRLQKTCLQALITYLGYLYSGAMLCDPSHATWLRWFAGMHGFQDVPSSSFVVRDFT